MAAERCWLASLPDAGPCDGALVRCHLIAQQALKREFPHGAYVYEDGSTDAVLGAHRRHLAPNQREVNGVRIVPLQDLLDDPRSWVPGCGGPTGVGGHHGQLDYSKRLRIARDRLPAAVEEFAAWLGLGWWLDKSYGEASHA